MRAALALLLSTLAAYLPLATVTPWKGTESRRVQIGVEMAKTGDYLVPKLAGEPTFAKPPLFYWCVAAVYHAVGLDRTAMRLPSILALALMAWLAFSILRRTHGQAAGWVGGAAIISSPVMLDHAAFAEIDPMFAVLTAWSLLWLGRAIGDGERKWLVGAGVIGGLALLAKGPPYFLFLAGALLVWWRHRRLRGLLWFLIPLVVVPACWVGALALRANFGEIVDVAGSESVGRALLFEWSHIVDTPLHFVRAALITLPFGLWTFSEYRGRHDARLSSPDLVLRTCAGAAVGGVVLMAFFPARPVRYLLPGLILFLCAVAPAVAAFARFPQPLRRVQVGIVRVIGALGAIGLIVLPWTPWPTPGASFWFAGFMAIAPLWVTDRLRLVALAVVAPIVAGWTVMADRAARYQHGPRSPGEVGAILRQHLTEHGVDDASSYGHFTNSLLFGSDSSVDGDELMRRPPTDRWVLLEQPDWAELPDACENYRDRVRLRAKHRTIVLLERDGS